MYQKSAAAAAAIVLLSSLGTAVVAQDTMGAYKQSMDKMNSEMKKGMDDPDATRSWAKMMIAHHQGAIEMNETVLKETKDPMIRKMAEKGIKEQKEEQKQLGEWLAKHDK
ncbi:uncharacterized protein (DUF305 family) [Bradyrhizobium sp. USDA 4011]|jgi:uncharacterized protein (DUF305 family)|uniref:DUF305 domain-containing protein n=1 Tax=Bradyrhizobium TaxID=374 RepID=UPI00041DB5DD|nr:MULTISPECIES: DUF305 domain-containing protein [Bradyrhizobium]MCL8488258.1 DUF305 domain-containing protein [Bradyrhizobium denitrificans]RTM15513.1 MAG: DUF305 domain-containing protein [Bradyrhizobiaceae bacterium]